MPVHRRSRFASVVALVVTTALVPASLTLPVRTAAAQGAKGPSKKDLEGARKAFMDGLELEASTQWHDARLKFEEVGKVRMTPEVRFHIALCEEHEGLLLESLRDFETAEADAKAEGKTAVMKEAPEHATAIKPRIPKLKLKVPNDVEGVTLTLDGNAVDPKNEDELPIDPGAHKIEASAEGRLPFSAELTLAEGESKTVTVKLPTAAAAGPKDEPPAPPVEEAKPVVIERKTSALAYVALGVGAVGLIGAGVFYAKRGAIKSDLEGACDADLRCKPDRQDDIDSGRRYTTLTNVFGAVGIVGVGVGVYLLVSAPKVEVTKEPTAARIRLVPHAPGADLAGFAIAGAF